MVFSLSNNMVILFTICFPSFRAEMDLCSDSIFIFRFKSLILLFIQTTKWVKSFLLQGCPLLHLEDLSILCGLVLFEDVDA